MPNGDSAVLDPGALKEHPDELSSFDSYREIVRIMDIYSSSSPAAELL